jgi:hypothetical protein
MMPAPKHELRQGAIIRGQGIGSMVVLRDGLSVIIPGLDAWYIDRASRRQNVPDDVVLLDKNLSDALGVDHFVQPPAIGISESADAEGLPVMVFPRWVVCSNCSRLDRLGPSDTNRTKCPECDAAKKKFSKRIQTNFVVACESGHLDEFPWVEFVHRSHSKTGCGKARLELKSRGSGDLRGQIVKCLGCDATRTLIGVSDTDGDTTFLSKNLDKNGVPFKCSGASPWLRVESSNCGNSIRMVLRNASNVYFSQEHSSILLPSGTKGDSGLVSQIRNSNREGEYQGKLARYKFDYMRLAKSVILDDPDFESADPGVLAEAFEAVFPNPNSNPADEEKLPVVDRSPEANALSKPVEHPDLIVRSSGYVSGSIPKVALVNEVPLLKKTSASVGFTRIFPNLISTSEARTLFRRNPYGADSRWFPAVRNVGEGIYLSLDLPAVKNWESQPGLIQRISKIDANLEKNNRTPAHGESTPRFVLLHTLGHLLIQELVVACGYTAAALSERVFASKDHAGLLVYTASAGSDGTMGGLVAMAQPESFRDVFETMIEKARWCSNDPICMDLGREGQGNSGANLAACQSCALLPETSCDHFNQGLDRATLVGELADNPTFEGFFVS